MTETAKLIEDIKTYMADAREMCERGEFIALEGLDSRVQQICTAVQSLEPKEAQAHSADLDNIMEDLVALQRTFEDKRAALGEELTGTGKHHKAAKAYAQHEHSAPKEG